MDAGARCGIDLDAAVDTPESIGSVDDESTDATGGEWSETAGREPIRSSDGESTGAAVVRAVADAKGVDPLDLDPLYDVIDGDALDAMFAERDGSDPLELRFTMAGCEVVVQGAGEVTVTQQARRNSTEAAPSHGD